VFLFLRRDRYDETNPVRVRNFNFLTDGTVRDVAQQVKRTATSVVSARSV
jgi:hypothetical protein